MGVLPNLSASFRARYEAQPDGTLQPGDGYPATSPLSSAILTPSLMWEVFNTSPVAKLDRLGRPVERWNYELPPMAVTAMLVQLHHVPGIAPRERMPFKLKAVGRVDANLIRRGGRGIVSDDFVIIP